MGAGMTRNLLSAGFSVAGFDVRSELAEALVAAGGESADSPAAAAKEADLLAVCVFDDVQAVEVLFGEHGALATLPQGTTVLMHTTMSPSAARGLEERLAASGHWLVDAPVTGGKVGADKGSLTIIASGSDAAFEAANPAFEAMGQRIYRVGQAAGAASTVKMVNQLLVGVHTVAAAEAITLAAKAGADPKVVYDVITHGGGNSASFKTRIPVILDNDFAPRGVVEIFTKDPGIVSDVAQSLDVEIPMAHAALSQFEAAVAAGLGRLDDAAVVKVYEARSGVAVAAIGQKTGKKIGNKAP